MTFGTLFLLASRSLWNRRFTTLLTAASVALSVALLLGVERVRVGARDSFSNTISQTHLIVGARGGPVQLLLYTVFRMGNATNNVSYESYQKYANHPVVEWTIPFSLGDSYRGFRVVGTNADFYARYRYRGDRGLSFAEGQAPQGIFDVALGSEVARELGHRMGDPVVVTHGVTDGPALLKHDDMPFRVVGILSKTGTPVDRAVYISLQGMEALHIDWGDGAPALAGQRTPAASLRAEDLEPKQITSFLVRLKSFPAILSLQREINVDESEPLMAIIPGVTLDELWRTIAYAEDGLRIVSSFVVLVGLVGMLVTLYASVNERRREMAILRAVGAHPRTLVALLVFESWLLGTLGALLGVVGMYASFLAVRPYVEREFGILLPLQSLSAPEFWLLGFVSAAALLIGLVPALRAYRNSLTDGLVIRI
ncbi:MAG: ABC transporter permease [Silvanigrellales bacterium]|nr:ABC transporter permease [Silvanigrellales bacterium]